ncbi:hypothetical protein CLV30_106118 [Haloactinopolyspora alba]|uniref:Uncharacterized protein n=1 Tax=Haloactinopolyspora alba TaxID=648780 RepID=A0A2P8E3Q9_9ACTN|nr:hypothetical protein [Haloactinopolyspora alba]PSL04115.1 hypothetical protein CLV30_106118 [Haloactinopolyspora alba]
MIDERRLEVRELGHAVARELASLTDGAWSADAEIRYRGLDLYGPNGERIAILTDNRPGRVEIYGVHDLAAARQASPRLESPTITVAMNRGAATVAREIVRRVLPTYRDEMARGKAALAAHRDAIGRRDAVMESLVSRMDNPSRPSHWQSDHKAAAMFGTFGKDGPRGEVITNSDGSRMHLEVNNVDPGLARELLDVIRKHS